MALPRRRGRPRAARADDERAQRRRARRQLGRLPGVHDRPVRRARRSRSACASAPRSSTRSRRRCTTRASARRSATRAASRPTSSPTRRRCRLLVAGIEAAGYTPGEDVAIALDPATSEIFDDGGYVLEHEGRTLSAAELADYWAELAGKYPIVSIEDGMDEEDWDGWKALTDAIGDGVQLVGDDLFVTNVERLRRGIELGVGNSILDQGQPDRHADRDARGDRASRARPATPRSCRTAPARPRTSRSPTSPSPPAAARSRPARRRAPIAWRSTTSCCASRRRSGSDADLPGPQRLSRS